MSDSLQRSRAILERLLAADFPGSHSLRKQLPHAVLTPIVSGDASLAITVPWDSEFADVVSRVPVEGAGSDADGGIIHFLLHVVEGRMCELEILREDGEAVAMVPVAESVEVY
jgi:hypothetical protein